MLACAMPHAFTAGLRALPARPARGAALVVRAASTRLPPSGKGASSSRSEVPSVTSAGELFSIYATLGLTGGQAGRGRGWRG